MKKIPLTNSPGRFAIVDNEDFKAVSLMKWKLYKGPRTEYAISTKTVNGVTMVIMLHRFIAKAKPGQSVSPRNGNKLDCQRANLVVHEGREYRKSSKLYKTNVTGVRGVYPKQSAKGTKYRVHIYASGKQRYLGTFDDIPQAAARVDEFLKEQNATQ